MATASALVVLTQAVSWAWVAPAVSGQCKSKLQICLALPAQERGKFHYQEDGATYEGDFVLVGQPPPAEPQGAGRMDFDAPGHPARLLRPQEPAGTPHNWHACDVPQARSRLPRQGPPRAPQQQQQPPRKRSRQSRPSGCAMARVGAAPAAPRPSMRAADAVWEPHKWCQRKHTIHSACACCKQPSARMTLKWHQQSVPRLHRSRARAGTYTCGAYCYEGDWALDVMEGQGRHVYGR